jgi:hypothetical protein
MLFGISPHLQAWKSWALTYVTDFNLKENKETEDLFTKKIVTCIWMLMSFKWWKIEISLKRRKKWWKKWRQAWNFFLFEKCQKWRFFGSIFIFEIVSYLKVFIFSFTRSFHTFNSSIFHIHNRFTLQTFHSFIFHIVLNFKLFNFSYSRLFHVSKSSFSYFSLCSS